MAIRRVVIHGALAADRWWRGEIVALDASDIPRIELLQRRLGRHRSPAGHGGATTNTPIVFMVFDLLWLDGRELLACMHVEEEGWRVPRGRSTTGRR